MSEDLSFLETSTLDKGNLTKLSEKINSLKRIRTEIKQCESRMKDLKNIEKVISGEDIPQFMSAYGIDSINLDDGSGVSVKESVYVSLPKTDPIKRRKVLEWVSEHGGSGIIKDNLTIKDPSYDIISTLDNAGYSYERKKDINALSLKAFIKNILGMQKNSIQKVDLADIPPEVNLFIGKETKIK